MPYIRHFLALSNAFLLNVSSEVKLHLIFAHAIACARIDKYYEKVYNVVVRIRKYVLNNSRREPLPNGQFGSTSSIRSVYHKGYAC